MKSVKFQSKVIFTSLSLILPFLMNCNEDPSNQLDGTTGLLKFNFDTEPAIAHYPFEIESNQKEGSDCYLIQNPDSLPKGTDITHLKASFQPINSIITVKVNGIEQKSGVTENDFTRPVVYEAYAENGHLKKYKVIVNVAKKDVEAEKYIFINQSTFTETEVKEISDYFGGQANKRIAVGLGVIISVLNDEPANILNKLKSQLLLSEKYNLPICVKLDAEIWWGYRSDLWNWWDPDKPGYKPENRDNVEWTDWNRDAAIKIGWLNWGRQIRMVPCPNLMSSEYKKAWRTELTKSVNVIKTWYEELPAERKDLFGGIVLGWESSIGVSVFHYPNGNSYIDQPESNDPTYGKTMIELPSRGVQTIGYAAIKTAGITSSGNLTEEMQTEVVRRHLKALTKTAFDLGIQRGKIFSHCGGWVEGETLYTAALNDYSCPGWSFYKYASDPTNDLTAMNALAKSDAPYWGTVEWLLQGNKTQVDWASALNKSLANNSRMVVIYNWNSINTNENALSAIKEINK
jgi:hypothetical protein